MKKHLFLLLLFLLALAIVSAVYLYGQRHFSGIVSEVSCGDFLTVFYDQAHQPIRLSGITVPQEGTPFFTETRDYLSRLVEGKRVEVNVISTLPDGKFQSDVFYRNGSERLSLSREMLRAGFAWAEGDDPSLAALQDQARAANRGMWAPPSLAHTPPKQVVRPSIRLQSQRPRGLSNSDEGGIYRWRDEKGTLNFSDRALSAQAEPVRIGEPNILPFPDAASRGPNKSQPKKQKSAIAVRTVTPPASPKKSITAADYVIKPSLDQKNGYLYLSGRIEGGPDCDRFTLNVSCVSEDNHHTRITHVAENLGGIMSDLLGGRTRVYGGNNKTRWEVTGIQGRCQD